MLNAVKLQYLTTHFIFKNYKLSFKFCPRGGDFVRKFCPGDGVFQRQIKWPRRQPGGGDWLPVKVMPVLLTQGQINAGKYSKSCQIIRLMLKM